MPFGRHDASFLTFWAPFWHLGTTLRHHFAFSGGPWEAILAPRDHPGGPWKQQDGHEIANNRTFVDLGVISGIVLCRFSALQTKLAIIYADGT